MEIKISPIIDEKIKEKLQKQSVSIQPDVVRMRDLNGVDEKGAELYDKMNLIYKDLCNNDVSFCLTFLTPTEQKPMLFYRTCDINNQERYQKCCHALFNKMYSFLYYAGFLDILEKYGAITQNKKPKIKTSEQELKENIE